MKKQKLFDSPVNNNSRNPVAKFAHTFNKAQVFIDKTKYRRGAKHKKQAVSLIVLLSIINEAACFIKV